MKIMFLIVWSCEDKQQKSDASLVGIKLSATNNDMFL